MKNLLRILLRTVLALVAIVVGLLLYVQLGGIRFHQDRIQTALSDAVGFEIAASEPLQLDLGRELELTVVNLAVRNAAWPDSEPLADVGRVRIVVDAWSLVSGPIEITVVELDDVKIGLDQLDDGRANWTPAPQDVATPAVEQDEAATAFILHEVKIDGVELVSAINGEPAWAGHVPQLMLRLLDASTYAFDTAADAAFADGTLTGNAALSGEISSDFSQPTPRIDLLLTVPELKIQTANNDEAEPGPTPEHEPARLFDDSPLQMAGLDGLDLSAVVSAENVLIDGDSFRDVHFDLSLENGKLNLNPLQLKLGDGSVTIALSLEPVGDNYAMTLRSEVEQLRVASMAAEGQDPAKLPPLDANLEISGTGSSLHQIMASSNGQFSGRHAVGEVNLQAAGVLFSDIISSITSSLNPLAESPEYATLECGIYRLDITDGIATVDELAAQMDSLVILSSGTIDLGDETIDLSMRTKTREGFGLSIGGVANSFLKLGGTLSEPSVNVDAAGSVTATGAAVASGGLSFLAKGLWDRLSAEVDLCKDDVPET